MMGFVTSSYYIVNGTPKYENTLHHDSHNSDYFCKFFLPMVKAPTWIATDFSSGWIRGLVWECVTEALTSSFVTLWTH